MCIICIEIEKNKLSPWEAERNLTEMKEKIDKDHLQEVENMILELKNQNLAEKLLDEWPWGYYD